MFKVGSRLVKWFGLAMLFLASAGFVLLGMGNLQFGERDATVAKVGDHEITQRDWDWAHNQDIDRLRAENPNLSLAMLDSPLMKYESLQRLVQDYVLQEAARGEHLAVSDSRLAAALQEDPLIQSLIGPDGKLDLEGYERLVAARGMSTKGFEENLRADLSRRQVLNGVVESLLASPAQVSAAMDSLREQRLVRIVRYDSSSYADELDPTDEQLQAYYQANLAQYQAPETIDIEYLVLDLEHIAEGVRISEQDLHNYYEQNKGSLGTAEERRASHILVAVADDAPAREREDARERAEELLTRVRAEPDSFATVAEESSDDELSGQSGGDLGFFRSDRGMDPAIAQATFDLNGVGAVSDLVATDFGYHILQLTEIKPADVPSFEDMKPQLERQFREQGAQERFSEMAEDFTNAVYEQPDSLEPAAEKLGLNIQTASGVTRTPSDGATGALANLRFLSALFSSDTMDNGNNTEATDVGTNQLASGRVVSHQAAHAQPFEEVRDQVQNAWVLEHGASAARKAGEDSLKAWKANPSEATDLPEAVALSRQEMHAAPPALVEAVLRTDASSLPTFVGVDLGTQGYAVAKIEEVLAPVELSEQEAEQDRNTYLQLWANVEAGSYYNYLKSRYKAKILVPAPSLLDQEDGAL